MARPLQNLHLISSGMALSQIWALPLNLTVWHSWLQTWRHTAAARVQRVVCARRLGSLAASALPPAPLSPRGCWQGAGSLGWRQRVESLHHEVARPYLTQAHIWWQQRIRREWPGVLEALSARARIDFQWPVTVTLDINDRCLMNSEPADRREAPLTQARWPVTSVWPVTWGWCWWPGRGQVSDAAPGVLSFPAPSDAAGGRHWTDAGARPCAGGGAGTGASGAGAGAGAVAPGSRFAAETRSAAGRSAGGGADTATVS